jgi:hypothetical protein
MTAALHRPIAVCRVSARGGRVPSWRFDRATGVLHAVFRARRAMLVAEGCQSSSAARALSRSSVAMTTRTPPETV